MKAQFAKEEASKLRPIIRMGSRMGAWLGKMRPKNRLLRGIVPCKAPKSVAQASSLLFAFFHPKRRPSKGLENVERSTLTTK